MPGVTWLRWPTSLGKVRKDYIFAIVTTRRSVPSLHDQAGITFHFREKRALRVRDGGG